MSTPWPQTLEEAKKGGLPNELDKLENRKARAFLVNLQVKAVEDLAAKVNPLDFVKTVGDLVSYEFVRALVLEITGAKWPEYDILQRYALATTHFYQNVGIPKHVPLLQALGDLGNPSMYVISHWGQKELQEFLENNPEIDHETYQFLRNARESYISLHEQLIGYIKS